MSVGDYIDAICVCLGGGLTPEGKAKWFAGKITVGVPTHPNTNPSPMQACEMTRLEAVMRGSGVYVLAEAASLVSGMVAT